MNKGYIVDFVRKTITITAEFEKAMRSPDDDAYKTIQQLCADFPGMRIVRRTHRTPSRYVSKQGVVSKCNPYKNLTYEKMEQFISALPNSTAYLKQYDFLKLTHPAFRPMDTALCAVGSSPSSPSTAKTHCSI